MERGFLTPREAVLQTARDHTLACTFTAGKSRFGTHSAYAGADDLAAIAGLEPIRKESVATRWISDMRRSLAPFTKMIRFCADRMPGIAHYMRARLLSS
jgi:hypothetical protein